MYVIADATVLSFSQGELRNLIVFLAAISITSWVLTLATTLVRFVVRFAYNRPEPEAEE
jgi:hypothetical protein